MPIALQAVVWPLELHYDFLTTSCQQEAWPWQRQDSLNNLEYVSSPDPVAPALVRPGHGPCAVRHWQGFVLAGALVPGGMPVGKLLILKTAVKVRQAPEKSPAVTMVIA